MCAQTADVDSDPDPHGEERALVERMLAGDEAAMEEFADGYFPGLYRFALVRLDGDPEITREIVQTTVCKALGKLASYRGEAALSTWLCACCRNEILMHFRRKRRQARVVALDEHVPDALDRLPETHLRGLPEGALARKEEARLVHATLDLLPARYARALEWKYVHRLPVEAIAGRLQLSAKAAESLLGRARRAFRQGYERLSLPPEGTAAQPASKGG